MPKGAEIRKEDADTALYVISRISGEGADRKYEKGDYLLSDTEEKELQAITGIYPRVIVILNVGGILDLSFLDRYPIAALLLVSLPGMEGGNAVADVLSGAVNPCGRLTDSWAYHYLDYPSSETFSHNNGNVIEEKYTEGIYVGYRYFDTFEIPVRYPFGYGLSYTDFQYETQQAFLEKERLVLSVKVRNTGSFSGREVIQIYASCPGELQQKESKKLIGFGKTGLLKPGEEELLFIRCPLQMLKSYHSGMERYLLEKGIYYILAGVSIRDLKPAAILTVAETIRSRRYESICPLLDALAEIHPDPEMIRKNRQQLEKNFDDSVPRLSIDFLSLEEPEKEEHVPDPRAIQILSELSSEEKAELCIGRIKNQEAEWIGNASVSVPGAAGETSAVLAGRYDLPSMVMADGPAGIRIYRHYQVNPENGSIYEMTRYQGLENRLFKTEYPHEGADDYYQYCTAIPVGTLLAQTFDLSLMEEIGSLIGNELEEFQITFWLAPGMNIHRNPLCGRNFEYYSEDPFLSGQMASSITRGVQKHPGVGTTIKHFACNNQEENRRGVSSIVSERALREIYLKGFEIAVKSVQPMAIMTSYNKINGVHTANSRDLCTTAARNEWGFQGVIMTDWTTTNANGGSSAAKCITAGNDLIMPGRLSDQMEIMDALLEKGNQHLEFSALDACVMRILELALKIAEERRLNQ